MLTDSRATITTAPAAASTFSEGEHTNTYTVAYAVAYTVAYTITYAIAAVATYNHQQCSQSQPNQPPQLPRLPSHRPAQP